MKCALKAPDDDAVWKLDFGIIQIESTSYIELHIQFPFLGYFPCKEHILWGTFSWNQSQKEAFWAHLLLKKVEKSLFHREKEGLEKNIAHALETNLLIWCG